MYPVSIGPYRIIEQLGLGGMGVVYRAAHGESNAPVAIKTVRVPRQTHLAGIRREIRALMRIQHPGVVRIVGEGVSSGLPWYAMELLEGQTLRDYHRGLWEPFARRETEQVETRVERRGARLESTLSEGSEPSRSAAPTQPGEAPRRARLPAAGGRLAEALAPLYGLCEALAFLHGEGIVHRDLKPDNVFIRAGGSPVLVDFGIITRFQGSVGREVLEVAGLTTGTAGYMAPEQIRGERVDARADLYSLGCMLYEVVTGQSPFSGVTGVLTEHHLYTEPGAPSQLVEGIPAPLEELILCLMAKRPGDRLGHADDVEVALGELLGRDRAARSVEPRPYLYRPELAGRGEAREQLHRQLARAVEGAGGFTIIGGESGVGKTCLAVDAARVATLRGMTVATGECIAGGVGGPLHPLRPVLQAIADRCQEQGRAVADRLFGARGKILSAIEPGLAMLPGQSELPEPGELPAEAARRRLLGALSETLAAFAEDKPLLVLLDDLQWADELTLAFLSSLPEDFFDQRRLLVLATCRTDEVSPALAELLRSPRTTRLELGRLDASTIRAMVSEMLALPAPPPEFVAFLARQSEGNPFFVAEYLRAAVAEKILKRNRSGQWQIAEVGGDYQSLPLPQKLRDLVARRLDGLSPFARQLSEAGAVLGREFEPELLPKVSNLDESETMEAIDELIARHVIEADETAGRLRFVHDKLREIAYAKTPDERRRALHHRAAEAIETRYDVTDELQQVYPILAHHYGIAEVDDKTWEYLERAAEQALKTAAYHEAAELYERALALDDKPGSSGRSRRSDPARRAHWEHGLGKAQFGLGDLGRAEEHTRHALERLGHPLPASKSGWVRLLLGQLARQLWHLAGLWRGGDPKPARREELGEAALAAGLMTHRYFYIDDALKMITAALLSVNLAERAAQQMRVPRSYSLLGMIAGLLKRHKLAAKYFERARDGAQSTHDSSELAFALIAESVYQGSFGRWLAAEQAATRALERLRDVHDPLLEELTLTTMGHVEYYTGRFEAARARYAEVLRSARERHNQQHATWGLFSIARSFVQLGRFDEAIALLDEARGELLNRPELASEVICFGLSALAQLRRGELEAARTFADQTHERIRRSRPTGFPGLDGYAGALEVYLSQWTFAPARAPEHAAFRRGARALVKALAKFAKAFPMAKPAALLYAGIAARLDGADAAARKLLTASLDQARQLGMLRDEAAAYLALAELESENATARAALLDEAEARYRRLGCAWQLERIKALKTEK